MGWPYFLGLVGIMVGTGAVCWIAWLRATVAQKRQDAEAARAQMDHAERMAMIEKGILPPAEAKADSEAEDDDDDEDDDTIVSVVNPTEDKASMAYKTLSSIGTIAPVFAWLSGSSTAWVAVAVIGSVCAIGAMIVYVGSLGNDDEKDENDKNGGQANTGTTPNSEKSEDKQNGENKAHETAAHGKGEPAEKVVDVTIVVGEPAVETVENSAEKPVADSTTESGSTV